MNLSDIPAWSLWGLIIILAIFAIAFFARNSAAKVDKDRQSDNPTKDDGGIAIAKSKSRD